VAATLKLSDTNLKLRNVAIFVIIKIKTPFAHNLQISRSYATQNVISSLVISIQPRVN